MRRVFAAGGLMIAVAGVLLAWHSSSQEESGAKGDLTYQAQAEEWEGIFSGDIDQAYSRFLEAGKALDYDSSHGLAHVIGETLFKRVGVGGISACTVDFAYGCYHGFAGHALFENGLSYVASLDEACKESEDPLGCLHGIGHGVLSYLGNEELNEALAVCAALEQESPVGGCFGGVFMEYNFNTMQSESGISVRPYFADKADEPCETVVRSEFRVPCFFDAPAWWHAAATDGSDDESVRFRQVGILCSVIEDDRERTVCYQGVGNVIGPTSGYDRDVIRGWCSEMGTREARDACETQAVGHMKDFPDRAGL